MNFYSTEGTKISINEGEYIDLNTFIKDKFKDLEFYRITDGNYWLTSDGNYWLTSDGNYWLTSDGNYWLTSDGNYWLTSDGRNPFLNLLQYFNKVFNINTFIEYINSAN